MLPGCPQDTGMTPPQGLSDLTDISVLSGQTAANWDADPAPDGMEVMVYLFNRFTNNQPMPAVGSLEFNMYEGTLTAAAIGPARPFSSRRVDLEQLKGNLAKTAFGWGYLLRLPWGTTAPKSSSVTLQIKYISPAGKAVLSEPTTVSMSPR